MENGNNIYFSGKNINPELVDSIAKKYADIFVPGFSKQAKGEKIIPLNAAQLRRFYGDVKNMELRWKNSPHKEEAFKEILPMIKLLKAKAAYAFKRDLVPDSFREWIGKNVDMINEARDFQAFLLYFEAVVGFCYGNGLKDK